MVTLKEIIEKGERVLREEGLRAFVKKSFRYIIMGGFGLSLGYILAPLIARKLRKLAVGINDVESAVKLAFSFNYLGVSIRPIQIEYEISELLKLLNEIKPKTVLEIGTARGGTLFLFCQVADPDATIISVDFRTPQWKTPIYRAFAKGRQRIFLIRGDSHDPATLEKIKSIVNNGVDFLFIDADHTYEGVKMDFEMYSQLMRRGGIVAFHDILPHDRKHDPDGSVGVHRFWQEIKQIYKHTEIIKDKDQGWAGIGVIYV